MLLAVQASSRINNMLKLASFGKSHASKLKVGLFDGIMHTEHNGTTFIVISKI